MTVLPWWRQRQARRRRVDAQLAAVDQQLGSRLDCEDRLAHIQSEVERLRRCAVMVEQSSEGGSFARGVTWGYDRVIELFEE